MASHDAYLRSSLSKYQYADLAKRDILNAFQTYSDLRPNLDTFVFNDGRRKELLCLDGTIPVTYKGGTYNIPVCLWLIDTHPHNPPMVYVKPTANMQIKPGRHVDSNGKVYLPYLHEWRHPQSDLLGLIQILVIVFGEDMPVFARGNAAPARPPYPATASSTPYPTSGGGMPTPSYPAAGTPYPAAGYPAASSSSGYPGYYPPQSSAATSAYPGYPPATSFPGGNTTTTASVGSSSGAGGNLSDEQIRASLLSAVEDKMKRRLREIFAQAQAEMDTLKKTQEDLQKGKTTLDEMLTNLEKEQNQVEQNITLLKEKDEEMKEVLSKMENREEVDIDEAVVPTAPLYKQLLNAFAEEQAIEDVIYYLGEALRKEVIDLDVFLKQVRELSKRQFMFRALIHKCRETAGLAEIA